MYTVVTLIVSLIVMPRCVLITGGAGYIGTATAAALLTATTPVVVVDNLRNSNSTKVPKGCVFYQGDITNRDFLEEVLQTHSITDVIHLAAYKDVGESMQHPEYYSDNITGTVVLLDLMVKYRITNLVFSSTAMVYAPKQEPTIILTEGDETIPNNYYGYTKLVCEQLITWYARVHKLSYTILRYFNVAGDVGLQYIDPYPHNIFPKLKEVLQGIRPYIEIYGTTYPTRDGTCVRDYVSLKDIVHAHMLALNRPTNCPVNIGTGTGTSVLELLQIFESTTGSSIPYQVKERRPGDIPQLVTQYDLARRLLGWSPSESIEDVVKGFFLR